MPQEYKAKIDDPLTEPSRRSALIDALENKWDNAISIARIELRGHWWCAITAESGDDPATGAVKPASPRSSGRPKPGRKPR